MKSPVIPYLFILVFSLVTSWIPPLLAEDGFAACRFVPERMDDFAFENDKVAFRIYGPALQGSLENSGVDCWLQWINSLKKPKKYGASS